MNNEPVAWLEPITGNVLKDAEYQNNPFANETGDWIPLYTNPVKELIEEKSYEVVFDGEKYTTKLVEPKVKELTDEEIEQTWQKSNEVIGKMGLTYVREIILPFARAILRKAQENG